QSADDKVPGAVVTALTILTAEDTEVFAEERRVFPQRPLREPQRSLRLDRQSFLKKTVRTQQSTGAITLIAFVAVSLLSVQFNHAQQPVPTPTPTPIPTLGLDQGYLEFDTP